MATKRAGKGDQNGEVDRVQETKGTQPSEHDARRSECYSVNYMGIHPTI